jgi:hypothetical protein
MKKKLNKVALIAIVSLFTCLIFASNTPGEEELATFANPEGPGVDPGATPINDYLIPMLLMGVILGYRLLKKNSESFIKMNSFKWRICK